MRDTQTYQAQTLRHNYYIPKDTTFIPLKDETRSHLSTNDCARHIDRSAQTLRRWASTQTGLLSPIKVGTQLMWGVTDIKALLNGGAEL